MPTEEQQQLLEQFAGNHPAFQKKGNPAVKPGIMSSRDGEPYNPSDVQYDTSGTEYLKAFPPRGDEGPSDQATPPPPPRDTQPQQDSGQPAETPEQKEERLYFGKYKSIEAAEKAWQERERLLRDRNTENIALKAAQTVMERAGFRAERPEPTPPRPENIPIQFDAQGQPFVPVDIIEKLAAQRAEEIARSQVNEVLQPLASMNTMTQKMQGEFPDFAKDNAEFSGYLQENPDIAERVSRDPEFAMPAAYLMFRELRGQQTRDVAAQTTQRSQQVVNQVRAQASAPVGSQQSTRSVEESATRERKMRELQEYGQQTGDWRPYRDFRTREALNMDGTLEAIARSGWGR